MNDRTVIRPGGRRPGSGNNQGDDKTVVRPRHQPNQPAQPARYNADPIANTYSRQEPPPPPPPVSNPPSQSNASNSSIVSNPLLELVSPLIALVSKVTNAREQIDVEDLRQHAIQEIEGFSKVNFHLPNDPELVRRASYGLCCLLDELVLNTPWGGQSSWSTESLLVYFHREAWGGENFFLFLDDLSKNPSSNFAVLEIYYVALDMGFEGKYRQLPNGGREVINVTQDLYALLNRYRGVPPKDLSPNWRGVEEKKNSLLRLVPQWVVWSVASGLGILAFISLSILLSNQADPIQRKLNSVSAIEPLVVTPANLSNLGQINFLTNSEPDLIEEVVDYFTMLSNALEFELLNNLVVIEKLEESTLVRLTDENLFRSGSDVLSPEFVGIVEKIGKTLSEDKLKVEVTGHTDNVPIYTIRFQNNWKLSSARAETVRKILLSLLHPNSRVSARGMADTKPVATNANPSGRAQNRRVEIVVLN